MLKKRFGHLQCTFTLHGEPEKVRALVKDALGTESARESPDSSGTFQSHLKNPEGGDSAVWVTVKLVPTEEGLSVTLRLTSRSKWGALPQWSEPAFYLLLGDLHVKAVAESMLHKEMLVVRSWG